MRTLASCRGGPAVCRTSPQLVALPMQAPTAAHLPQAARDASGTLLLQADASAICTDKGALAQASAFAAASGSGTCTASAAAEAQAVCLAPTAFTQATASAFASECQGAVACLHVGLWQSCCLASRQSRPAFCPARTAATRCLSLLKPGTLPLNRWERAHCCAPVALQHCFRTMALHWHHVVHRGHFHLSAPGCKLTAMPHCSY